MRVRIEGIINWRPLTAVSDDCRDPLPITTAHLAIGKLINQLSERKERPVRGLSKGISACRDYLVIIGSV